MQLTTKPVIVGTHVFLYCNMVSDYFRNLEEDGEAWTVAPEHEFLEPMPMAWLVRLGAPMYGTRAPKN